MMFVFLIGGFLLLVKGADLFVGGACSLSKRLKIPAFLVGLTVVAFGTSMPEAAVSITAAIEGSNGIALGNVVGSNIFNTLVVLGMSAIFTPIHAKKSMLQKDFPFSIVISIVLLFLCFDFSKGSMSLSVGDGLILLALFGWFLYTSIIDVKNEKNVDEEGYRLKLSLGKCLILIILGLAGVIIGGQLTVKGAVEIARLAGLSEATIGLTIVAIGTSLPELVTSIAAARRGENDIALGNVIGSNIFNILFILGASASISAMPVEAFSIIDITVLIGISICTYIAIRIGKKINRPIGIALIATYIAYTVMLLIR